MAILNSPNSAKGRILNPLGGSGGLCERRELQRSGETRGHGWFFNGLIAVTVKTRALTGHALSWRR